MNVTSQILRRALFGKYLGKEGLLNLRVFERLRK